MLSRYMLRKEIAVIILLKLIGLMILYHYFFSHPTDHTLSHDNLAQHYMT